MGKVLTIDKIGNRAMIPVLRRREILKARVLTANEKKGLPKGSPDILALSPLGQRGVLDRNDVMKNYRYLKGTRIYLSGWRSGREYIIMRMDKTPAAAIMVPPGHVIKVNNTIAKSGSYIVCLLDSSGSIDRATASVISKKMFRKMFTIPPNDIINKHKNKSKKAVNDKPAIPKEQLEQRRKEKITKIGNARPLNVNQKIRDIQNTGDKKFKAIGKLMSRDDKMIGFVVQDDKDIMHKISKKEMLLLCQKKLVENVVAATREADGAVYLRGNGIKIGELPHFYN